MLSGVRQWSVATRMVVSALVLMLLVLPIAGGVLAWNFREAVNTSFNDRLESLLDIVIAGTVYVPASDRLAMERELGDARFTRVYSGWYWQVRDQGDRVTTSRSLWDLRLPVPQAGGLSFQETSGPQGQALRVVSRQVRLANAPSTVQVSVAADLSGVNQEVDRFEALLAGSLATLGVLLLAMVWMQVRWGLRPLRRLEQSLGRVEAGQQQLLDTDLPEELARLAQAINLVLERDQRLIERGRATAGNLAHALKTPVSVLQTLSERLPRDQQGAFQAELRRLNEAVRHHLARASAAGPAGLGGAINVEEALEPVLAALRTLASRRGLAFESVLGVARPVRVERQDLQELAGNLLENAINWAESRVRLSVEDAGTTGCQLQVEDDGPGMSEEQCNLALARGARLDETRPGSGLGLAIVGDLVALYGGSLALDRSPLGGLQVTVSIPGE